MQNMHLFFQFANFKKKREAKGKRFCAKIFLTANFEASGPAVGLFLCRQSLVEENFAPGEAFLAHVSVCRSSLTPRKNRTSPSSALDRTVSNMHQQDVGGGR